MLLAFSVSLGLLIGVLEADSRQSTSSAGTKTGSLCGPIPPCQLIKPNFISNLMLPRAGQHWPVSWPTASCHQALPPGFAHTMRQLAPAGEGHALRPGTGLGPSLRHCLGWDHSPGCAQLQGLAAAYPDLFGSGGHGPQSVRPTQGSATLP